MRSAMPIGAALVIVLSAGVSMAQGPGSQGVYSGPNVLSRWSRMPGNGASRGPVLSGYLNGTYSYLDGLVGPVTDFNNPGPILPGSATNIPASASHTFYGGGGLNLHRVDARSSFTVGYQGTFSRAYSKSDNAYGGANQNFNLNYERQLSRRWGFYTGHSAGSQSSILGLARPTSNRNFFDQSYSVSNEALDARLKYLNSGAGLYFQKSSRLTFSMDGGTFVVSRTSKALASSRGERAQGEIAYRTSRSQSVGFMYSFSRFYFPRGFGETYSHSVMFTYTRRLNRTWSLHAGAGPYRAESERLIAIAVDPFIAALTGQTSTISVFHGIRTGLGAQAGISGVKRHHSFNASYRRAVDPGNGLTLTALNDFGQVSYGYQASRNWSFGAALFASRLNPLLAGADRNADFRSYGGNLNASRRLTRSVHVVGNFALHTVNYDVINVNRVRRAISIGLAFSPGDLPLGR